MPLILPKNLIKYLGLILLCFVVVGVFVTATTFIQLAVAILIYPLLVIFAYKVFSHKLLKNPSKRSVNSIKLSVKPPVASAQTKPSGSNVGIADIDKRVLLKLIGGTGLTLFLFSLFSRKAEDILFKNIQGPDRITLTGPDGEKIIPAQTYPLYGYTISEIEDNTISFFGYIHNNGSWYVLRLDTIGRSFRYAKGGRDFPGAWENRENLDYGYFNDVFNQ